jgi:diaminohydroxyphosphoribosylaminopyrimidine deaminase/5-amino-6-(5-phosphoribosylamino)uracil reductase
VTPDEKYMQVALRLARRGIGSVEPNPVVGCIIVKGGQIIGRGWHRKFGGPHAEVNALENCQKNGISPRNAAMYVTLEPCCHHGKTSPCTDAIVEADLAKVVVATLDPSEHAGGKGIKQLRNAGIEVQTGLCEEQAKLLNAPFIKFAATGRCWVILKWAQSIDGMLAWANKGGNHRWISGEKSRKDVHKLRRRAQATLVGVRTVLADDPLLTARPSKGKKPLRVVLDSNLRTPVDCKLLATAKKSPVLIVTSQEAISANPPLAKKIAKKGAELLAGAAVQGRCDLNFLIDELSRQGIAQLLVEGGPTVITSFLKQGLADEICVYIAPKILGPQGSVNITEPIAELSKAVGLYYVNIKRFDDDIRITGLLEKAIREISISGG